MKPTYLLLVFALTCMLGCKRDSIDLDGGRPGGGWFGPTFSFYFKVGKTMDYKVEIDASKSSPHLNFHKPVRVEKGDVKHGDMYGGPKGNFRSEPFGNKVGANVEEYPKKLPHVNEYGETFDMQEIFFGIDLESIKVDKEDSFVIKVYKGDKIIDCKNINFIVGTKPEYGEDFMDQAYLKKLCIDNWKNIGSFDRYSKLDFLMRLDYYNGCYPPIDDVEAKKKYDDCYIEDPESDRY